MSPCLTLLMLAAPPPLTLEQAVELAEAAAADVVTAKEDVVLVDAEYMAARAAILPRVDLQLTAGEAFSGTSIVESRGRTPQDGAIEALIPRINVGPFRDFEVSASSNPQFTLGLQVTQLIYDGGRWWTQLARVDDVEASRRATVDRLRADVRLKVAQAFYGHEAARQAADVVEAQILSDERQLARARGLVEAGRAKSADVAAAARNLAQDRSERARKRLVLKQSAHDLNVLLGRPAELELAVALPADLYTRSATVAPVALEALLTEALRSRPEVAALDAERAAALKAVTVAEADYYPNVSLAASYRKQSRRPDRVFGDPTENYQAGLDLTVRWNVFEGLGTDARVRQAESAVRKLDARRAELLRSIEAEVADRAAAVVAQAELVALSADTVAAAEEALRLARGLFDEGRGTLLEVRDAELQVLQAKISGIAARLDLEIAREALGRALGAAPAAAK